MSNVFSKVSYNIEKQAVAKKKNFFILNPK